MGVGVRYHQNKTPSRSINTKNICHYSCIRRFCFTWSSFHCHRAFFSCTRIIFSYTLVSLLPRSLHVAANLCDRSRTPRYHGFPRPISSYPHHRYLTRTNPCILDTASHAPSINHAHRQYRYCLMDRRYRSKHTLPHPHCQTPSQRQGIHFQSVSFFSLCSLLVCLSSSNDSSLIQSTHPSWHPCRYGIMGSLMACPKVSSLLAHPQSSFWPARNKRSRTVWSLTGRAPSPDSLDTSTLNAPRHPSIRNHTATKPLLPPPSWHSCVA